ncbi:DUF2795 domain-containing protein [Vallicoccus soli]|uniref:DUF2795 domain-containing protein n=1 Tax=Vallicoccus soli TaxID=2339232 RepID=A0A3A3Z1K9_9ACTN|nr:DUF2795 domain-containing protein [Vallicoccus soli]RJK96407.1 DUF2795 domain-containing protein [Vallicoccus soli]
MATYEDVIGHLGEVDFPADKDAIIEGAVKGGAPDDVVRALRALPPVEYASGQEVARSAGVTPT